MTRIAFALSVLLAASVAAAGDIAVPPLSELRKPVEESAARADEGPVMPNSVNPARRVDDPARLCPVDAVWYLAVPDAGKMVEHWNESPPGLFIDERGVRQVIRNNRFGLNFLFSDLPDSVITPQRVSAIASCFDLGGALAREAASMAMAGFIDGEGRFSFVFLLDVGLDRVPAFEIMTEWETSFFLANPGTRVQRGNHAENFIDVWSLREEDDSLVPAMVAAGFAENIAVVSNNGPLAQQCLDLLSGGDSVASSSWGRRLIASVATSSSADAIAYLRMDALLEGLRREPIARQAVLAWADYVGHGGKDGEALFYGLQFTPEGTRETFLLPVSSQPASSSLVELLAKRLRPTDRWITPNVVPYQPAPMLFLAAQLEGRQLGGLLRQERRLFGLSTGPEYFSLPSSVRRVLTNDVVGAFTGEIGLAFYHRGEFGPVDRSGNREDSRPWLMILPCTQNPESMLPKAELEVERAGSIIYSRVNDWRNYPSWTVITSDTVRRAGGHYLVIASHGDLILAAIDQMVSGSSFSTNRDFAAQLAKVEIGSGLIFYVNVPEMVIREYPNLSSIMRSIYPRSAGLNSRPPLALLRRYSSGVLGAIAPSSGDGNGGGTSFTRLTVQAPLPMFGAMAASMVLRFPASMRSDARLAMEKSRENLQSIWLRLQMYSSRFGHFPEDLDQLMSEMRTAMTPEEVRSTFIAPAALSRLTPEAALRGSYTFLSGVIPGDEPDVPIVYESRPWSQDFSGMFPADPERAPSESGTFQHYRQYIRLDGKIVIMPEKVFQERMVERLRERE